MRVGTNGVRRVRCIIIVLAAVSLVGSLAVPSGAYQRPGRTSQLDLAPDNRQPISGPEVPGCQQDEDGRWNCGLWSAQQTSISGNGRFVAFSSFMIDLVERDTNLTMDVFVRDTRNGQIERVSISSNGEEAMLAPRTTGPWGLATNNNPSISRDGRFVAFTSSAPNLVAGDTNSVDDVFVHDRKLGKTERVSIASDGEEGNRSSSVPSISASGRYVAFDSGANFFVHDRKLHVTEMVSVASDGSEGTRQGGSRAGVDGFVSISGTGRYVAFSTTNTGLVPNDTGIDWDVFLHDRKSRRTEIVSLATNGRPPSDKSSSAGSWLYTPGGHAISDDGRYVTYASTSSELVPNDTNQIPGAHLAPFCCTAFIDTFVYDRKSKRTERVSVTSYGGEQGAGEEGGVGTSNATSITPDGRYVAFGSFAGNLATDDTAYFIGIGSQLLTFPLGDGDIFVYDRQLGTVEMVSRDSQGKEAQGCLAGVPAANPYAGETYSNSDRGTVSDDGRFVAFSSCGLTLRAEGDERARTNPWFNVFMRDRGSAVSIGGLGGSSPDDEEPPDDRVCVTPDLCIPPGGAVSYVDPTDDLDEALTDQGANLYGASLANRPQYDDLFAVIELEHMPPVLPGISPIFYGLSFEAGGKSYEVRATSFLGGTFGLFDCSDSSQSLCTKIADLRGGYGTTGMRVVFSIPLDEIGLHGGRKLKDVEAFSALGGYATGATKVLDRVLIK